jgi:DNA-binding transcriptional ArsR family regulator
MKMKVHRMLDSMRRFKAGIFQALAHPTRIALVEHLQHGSLSVGQLCDRVGIEQANASQHLAVLRNRHIVQTRKEGNQIFYSLRDPLLGQLLEVLRQYFLSHINEALAMLREEEKGAEPGLANQEAER